MGISPGEAAEFTKAVAPAVAAKVNDLTQRVFRTRGGRLGSGMGLLLEGLWGYYTSNVLAEHGLEMAWLADNQYNDFACLEVGAEWDPITRGGELFRTEAKSMNVGADESKAHFDELAKDILPDDLLLVIMWRWVLDGNRSWPCVQDIFIDRALPLAEFRDTMHSARGGSFVDPATCPDQCIIHACSHAGEPLNANGKRERLQGPETRRVSAKVSHAANFGGLVRMLKARGPKAKKTLRDTLQVNAVAQSYVDFIARNGVVPDDAG